MNKTEPVREAQELRDFGSSDIGKFGSAELTKLHSVELTNLDSVRSNESFTAGVWNFQTPAPSDSPRLALPNSDTSELRKGVGS